jgi:hypothetical protein
MPGIGLSIAFFMKETTFYFKNLDEMYILYDFACVYLISCEEIDAFICIVSSGLSCLALR